MAQQTAISWLEDKLKETYDKEGKLPLGYTFELLSEAKEMEKDQIIKAIKDWYETEVESPEQYYNETYNK